MCMKIEVGQVFETSRCGDCVVTAYHNSEYVEVVFPETGYVAKCQAFNLRKGWVKDPYCPTVQGVGFIGEGKHPTSVGGKQTRAYSIWKHMLERCYSHKLHKRRPSYRECVVARRWHCFQQFANDLITLEGYNNWIDPNTGYELDKDIKIPGNKVYSVETCMFVSKEVNSRDANTRRYYE